MPARSYLGGAITLCHLETIMVRQVNQLQLSSSGIYMLSEWKLGLGCVFEYFLKGFSPWNLGKIRRNHVDKYVSNGLLNHHLDYVAWSIGVLISSPIMNLVQLGGVHLRRGKLSGVSTKLEPFVDKDWSMVKLKGDFPVWRVFCKICQVDTCGCVWKNDGGSRLLRLEIRTRNISNLFLSQKSDSETPMFVWTVWTHNNFRLILWIHKHSSHPWV